LLLANFISVKLGIEKVAGIDVFDAVHFQLLNKEY